MDDVRAVPNQVNLVVRDMDAAVAFYERLGAAVLPAEPPWDRHHRTVTTPDGLDFDLDSTEFAGQWNEGWMDGRVGAVLGFGVSSRGAVDAVYADLIEAGHTGEQPPYDAFWGARYAVVRDPDGNSVGIKSPIDPDRRTTPPTPGV